MTNAETVKMLAVLKVAYPRSYQSQSKEEAAVMSNLWAESLQDLDYQTVSNVVSRWIATEKWPPSIAEIRSGAVQLSNPTMALDWAGGWGEVTRAISNYGAWNKQAALESMSPTTSQCVESIGWNNICMSENISIERGHFRTMFEERTESISKAERIPPSLRNPAEDLLLELGDRLKLTERSNNE